MRDGSHLLILFYKNLIKDEDVHVGTPIHKYKLIVQYCVLNLQVFYLLWSVNNE